MSLRKRWSSRWCSRQTGTVNSSLSLRPSAPGPARTGGGADCRAGAHKPGRAARPQTSSVPCPRYLRASPIGSTLLSMPAGFPERPAAPVPLPLRGPGTADRFWLVLSSALRQFAPSCRRDVMLGASRAEWVLARHPSDFGACPGAFLELRSLAKQSAESPQKARTRPPIGC